LIICGKVLTALCNNVNFGGKEKYMEYLNPFLQVHREEAREFLQWAMSFDEVKFFRKYNKFKKKINNILLYIEQ